jgi:hypothetical protein
VEEDEIHIGNAYKERQHVTCFVGMIGCGKRGSSLQGVNYIDSKNLAIIWLVFHELLVVEQ